MVAALLALALQLLIAAQAPNVPLDVKTEAIHVATLAINFAQNDTTAPQAATVTPIAPTFGSISTPTTCVENPTLDFSIATTAPKEIEDGMLFKATYQTGCAIDPNTKWDIKSNLWRSGVNGISDYDYGSLKDAEWSIQDTIAYLQFHGIYHHQIQSMTLTVGSTTETIQI